MAKPNFLIIITDQFHPGCLGFAGHPVVKTPYLDALAASGVVFGRCYSNQPLCMPARATLFTGLPPRGHGVRMNGMPLDPSVPTFTEALRHAGYRTHCAGKIHLKCSQPPHGADVDALDPAEFAEVAKLWHDGRITELPHPYYGLESTDYVNGHGDGSYGQYINWLKREHPDQAHLFFDQVSLEEKSPAFSLFNRKQYRWALPAELHPTHWVADRTIDFLEAHDSSRPFCLMCSIQDPHSPFAAPEPYCRRYSAADVPDPVGRDGELDDLPPHFRAMVETPIKTSGNQLQPMNATEPYAKDCIAQYFGLIEMIDDQVGRLMQTLRDQKLDENTVVMFVADHGEALGEHGLWGKGPYHYDSVIHVPFVMHCPSRFKQGVRSSEVVSLLDFAPTILDLAEVNMPDEASIEAPDAPPARPGRSVKAICEGIADDDADRACIVEMDEDYLGFKMRTLVTQRYRLTCYSGQPNGELFDLKEDPHELRNLWDDASRAGVRDELRLRLLDELMKTDISLPRQTSRS